MADEISRATARRTEQLHRDILSLVSIPSVSTDRDGARRALEAFLAMARNFGFETRIEAGGDVGVADYGPSLPSTAETLGILAHVDVVDSGDPASWAHAPWGEISEGAVWGRGTQDDKGPLVICLHAARALIDLGIPFRKRLRFVVGTMEETDWADMRAWRIEGRVPDYGFTPDGAFPVGNGEKGYCDVWLSFDRRSASALGPHRLIELKAGASINSVPDLACAVLEGTSVRRAAAALLDGLGSGERRRFSIASGPTDRVEIAARGAAAHSSMPERGDNALVRLCTFLRQLGRNSLVDMVAGHFGGDHRAASLGLQTRPERAFGEYIGPTTASADIALTKADSFTVGVNLRTAYGQTEGEIVEAFAAAAPLHGFAHRFESFMPAILVPRDRPFMRAMAAAYERRTGLPGGFVQGPGTSYAKALPGIASFGPILPGMPDLCHRADERMTFEEIARCAEIYADAIRAIVASPEPCG